MPILYLLDISESVGSLTALIYALLPVIFVLMIVGIIKKSGKKLSAFAYIGIGVGLLGLLTPLFIPGVAAAIDASPGSTTTMMGMPVNEAFDGLAVSEEYDLVCTSDSNSTTTVTSDSAGEATCWITPPEYGQNTYVLQVHDTHGTYFAFSIDNMDVLPFIMPVIILSVVLLIVGSIKKGLI